jgi:uncharacterized protein YjiS (DUF1127 family)
VQCRLGAAKGEGFALYLSHRSERSAKNGSSASKAQGKGIIMNVARSFNNWRKYRQTVAELGRMSTRELHDLGIDRGEIRNVARAAIAG